MSRVLPLAFVPLAVLLAIGVRASGGSRRAALDEESALHLRRVELALAEGRMPLADSFLDPGGEAGLPDPPFLDSAMAAVAGGGEASPTDGGIERRLFWVGPVLGGVTSLLVALIVLCLARGEWSGLAALVAAGAYALWPAALRFESGGGLHAAAPLAAVGALGGLVLAQTVTARDPFDWIQGGLVGGLLAGLALVLGPGALFVMPLLALGFALLYGHIRDERRGGAGKALMLFALSAAVLTSLAADRLPGEGMAERWMEGASMLAFAIGAPLFAAPGLVRTKHHSRGRGSLGRWIRLAGALVGLAALPLALREIAPRLGLELAAWRLAPWGFPSWPRLVGGALATLAALAVLREGRAVGGPSRALAWAALLFVPLAEFLPGARAAAAVTGAAVLGLGVVALPPVHRLPLAGALLVGLVGLLRVGDGEARRLRDEADALERLGTLPAVPHGSAVSAQGRRCLAPFGLGARLAYLGHRPPAVSPFGRGAATAARLLGAASVEELAGGMGGLGAWHVLGGSLVEACWSDALAGRSYAESALARLVREGVDPQGPLEEVLRLGSREEPLLVVFARKVRESDLRHGPSLRAR